MVPTLGYQWTHATGLFACISRAFRAFFAVFPVSLPIDSSCGRNTNHERKRNEAGSCVHLCVQWICYSHHQLYSMCTYHRRRIEQYNSMMSMIVTQALPFSIAIPLLSSVTGCKKREEKELPTPGIEPGSAG